MDDAEISIHAPLVGGDGVPSIVDKALFLISIHAPLVGGDFRKFQVSQYQKISIHAPLVGGD